MEIVRGRSVLKRTAVGRLQYYEKEEPSVVRRQVEDTERELSRYEQALEQAEKELEALYGRALGEAGADSAAVFMGHRMLLKDEEYRNSVIRAITEGEGQRCLCSGDGGKRFLPSVPGDGGRVSEGQGCRYPGCVGPSPADP